MIKWKKREEGVWNLYFDSFFDRPICSVIKLAKENEYRIKSKQCAFNQVIISGTIAGAKANAMLLVAGYFRERVKYFSDMQNEFQEAINRITSICSKED